MKEKKETQDFLKQHYNYAINACSPIVEDLTMVVKQTEDGDVFTYVPTDAKQIVASHGTFSDWQLNTLLKAGISPQSVGTPRTGLNSRIEGIDVVNQAAAAIDAEFAAAETPTTEE